MNNEIRKALCEGEINLGPVAVKCAVLENKERVISQREVVKAITGNAKGGLDRYLQPQNLQPYIPEKFRNKSLDQATLKYISLNGKTGQCFSATDIVDFLDMYLQARKDKKLLPSQEHLADQAEMIMRSLAKTGIIALIDEATGFQINRKSDALRIILQKYIAEALQKWVKQFDDAFIHIDLKTVQSSNIGDFVRSIFVKNNQISYNSTYTVNNQKREFTGANLPHYYNKDNTKKYCLTYFLSILHDSETFETLCIYITCFPNGLLQLVYKGDVFNNVNCFH